MRLSPACFPPNSQGTSQFIFNDLCVIGGESVSQTEIQMDLEPSRKSTLVPLNQCLIATEIQMDFVPSPPSQAMM